MLPAPDGALTVILKAAVPVALEAAIALLRVTVQVSSAPALEGKLPQLTAETPVTPAADRAITPAGSCSLMVADRPLAVPPLLPRPKV